MNPNHHLYHSQRFLDWVPADLAAGNYARAANSLGRAASHAVTAAAIHWNYPYRSRRRLTIALGELLDAGKIPDASHRCTFRQVYDLPDQIAGARSDAHARRIICHALMPVCRLRADIAAAAGIAPPAPDPNAPSPWERAAAALARNGARPLSPPEIVAIARPEARYLLRQ